MPVWPLDESDWIGLGGLLVLLALVWRLRDLAADPDGREAELRDPRWDRQTGSAAQTGPVAPIGSVGSLGSVSQPTATGAPRRD